MKKSILILSTLFMISCGGSESEKTEEAKELTYDEKVTAVCECFEKAEESEFMKCAKLQHDYNESLEEDKRQEFLLTTNECM